MKKNILLGLLVILTTNVFGQSITRLDFNHINNQIRSLIFSIDSEKDFHIINEEFLLNDHQSKALQIVADNYNIPFNLGIGKNVNYMYPFYMKSDIENQLFLTIVVINNSNLRTRHKKGRCQYFFILQCNISLNKSYSVVFEDVNLITDEKEIEEWFLKNYKSYLKNTEVIKNLYDYVPPPPFLPPNTLD